MMEHTTDKTTPWSLKDVLGMVVSLIVIDLFLGLVWYRLGFDNGPVSLALSYLAQILLTGCAFWFFAVRKHKITRADFRWKWLPLAETRRLILIYFVIYFSIELFFILIQQIFSIQLPGFEGQESHVLLFGFTPLGISLLTLIAVVLAPIVEEIVYRSFMLTAVASQWGQWWGIAISSILFASIHFEFQSFFPLLILGIVMGSLFNKTKSLQTAILFHMFNNAIAMLVELDVIPKLLHQFFR